MIQDAPHPRDVLMTAAKAYCRVAGISLANLSRQATGDHAFLSKVQHGKSFTTTSYDRVMTFIADNPVPVATEAA